MSGDFPPLEVLLEAYEQWTGSPPDHVVELGGDGMHVLFYDPEQGSGADDVTLVGTAGVSRWTTAREGGPYELVLEIEGSVDEKQRERIAKDLGELAVRQFRGEKHLIPGAVVDATVYPFERMPHVLVAHKGPAGEPLGDLDPEIYLLGVYPLFPGEAAKRAEMDEPGALLTLIRRKKLSIESPNREPAF